MAGLQSGIQPIPEVFLDESGNTGPDLGNLSQPIYSLASILGDASSIAEATSQTQGELKWSDLARTPEGRDRILAIVGRVDPATTKTAIADKRYMAMAKMVDELIEPALESNWNFYASGTHRHQTDRFFLALLAFGGDDLLSRVVQAFVRMMRLRTSKAADDFYSIIDEVRGRAGELHDEFRVLSATEEIIRKSIIHSPPGVFELDPSIPLVLALSHAWTNELGVPHRFVHDNSAALQRWKPKIEQTSSMTRARETIVVGEIEMTLPLLTFELAFADSAHSAGIQVADVIAGATRYLALSVLRGATDHLSAALKDTALPTCVVNGLWFVPPGL